MTTEAELLTVPEAADVLRTTVKAVYALVERGQLPTDVIMRLGRRVLFRRDALRRYLGLVPSLAPSVSPAVSR